MQAITTATQRHFLAALLLSLSLTTHAAEDDSYVSAMNYLSLDAQGDNADSRQFSGTGSFALGKYLWLQGTVGKLTDDSTNGLGDLNNYGFGTGLKGEHAQLSVNFSHYRNDANYTQRDVTAALDWYAKRFSVGLDVFHRNTDKSFDKTFTRVFPVIGATTFALHADGRLTGSGFGLHGGFNLTEQLSLSLGGMSYDYDSDFDMSTNLPAPIQQQQRTFFGQLIRDEIRRSLQQQATSGLTRSLALLDSSYNLGLSYLLDSASLSAQYFHDTALDSDATTNTVTLGAVIFVGDHWIVAPQIGQSRSDDADDVTFAGLSLSYNW